MSGATTMKDIMLKNMLSGLGHTIACFQDVGDQDSSQEAHENKAGVFQRPLPLEPTLFSILY